MNKQRGFGVIEVILIIVIFAILALIGWRLYTFNQGPVDQAAVTADQTPEVKTEGDLEKAEQFLSQSDIDQELSTKEIDESLE